jgi:hypothetical protein
MAVALPPHTPQPPCLPRARPQLKAARAEASSASAAAQSAGSAAAEELNRLRRINKRTAEQLEEAQVGRAGCDAACLALYRALRLCLLWGGGGGSQ